jgi:hypothetical protein
VGYARGVDSVMSGENSARRSVSNIQVLHVTHPVMGGGSIGHGDLARPHALDLLVSCLSSLPL